MPSCHRACLEENMPSQSVRIFATQKLQNQKSKMLVSTTIRTINDDDDTQKLDQPEFGIAYHVSMGLWMHIIYT